VSARAPQQRVDLAIALVVAVLLASELATSTAVDGPVALNLVVLLPAAGALAWRRRPLVAIAGVSISYVISGAALTDIEDLSTTLVPPLVAAYAAGRYAADLRSPAALLAATVAAVNLLHGGRTADDWIFPLVAFGAALLAGRALRTRALVAAQLAERTERLAAEQDLRAAEAALAERRRIARELHDVIAHTLSVMVVQAGGARRVLDRDADRAGQALETVEATGREALDELRRMLGFVTDSGLVVLAPTEPQPTLADLASLTRRAGAAGLPTSYEEIGPRRPDRASLPAGAEIAAYRIVQESLTNALKHAGPGATASVTARWTDTAFMVEICDDGAGAGTRLPSGGHGLIGMRERVALYGGELEAGPRRPGGFRVAATLPLAAAVEATA
jgi:signal transduction histidine kinase